MLAAAATKSGRLRRQNLITEMEAAYNCRSTIATTTTDTEFSAKHGSARARAKCCESKRVSLMYPVEDTERGDAIRQWSRRSTSECRLHTVSEDLVTLDSHTDRNVRERDEIDRNKTIGTLSSAISNFVIRFFSINIQL